METTLELPPEIAAPSTRSLRERQAATIAALDSFMEQDEDEHRETLRVLRQSLDEDQQNLAAPHACEGSGAF